MAPGDGFGQTEALMVNEGGVGGWRSPPARSPSG